MGTLIIKKQKPCKAERRQEMYYTLERMIELKRLIEVGKNAEKSLKELEEDYMELCKMEIEGEE